MFKALIAALGVTLGLCAIPVVHFVTGPVSPFIGGFFGGRILKAHLSGAMNLGLLMGLVVVGGSGIVIAVIGFLFQIITGDTRTLVILAAAGASLYITVLGAFGALIGGNRSRT